MKIIRKSVLVCMAIIMTILLAACGNNKTVSSLSSADGTTQTKAFPEFQGTDFEGNSVDESLFGKNEVTLLNFWFNGCSACVNEMPELEELNKKLREKGAELIGINVEAGESEKLLSEAKEILEKQGATYRNLFITGGQEAKEYIGKIFAFPTTITVDKKGNIIGDPITGSIEDEKRVNEILKMVDDVKNGKTVASYSFSEKTLDDKLAELGEEQNNIFLEHQEVWDKVFNNIEKNKIEQMTEETYGEFLKKQIEAAKDSFDADERKLLDEDLRRIVEIEKQIQDLTGNK